MPRRRMQAKGNIYQDGNWWRLRWWEDERQPDGSLARKRRSTILGPAVGPGKLSKKQAQMKAQDDVLHAVNARAFQPQSMMSLGQFIERHFIPEVVEMRMKHSGKLHYDYCLGKLVEGMGQTPLRDLDPAGLQRWFTAQLKNYSVQTVMHFRNALSAVMEHARRLRMYTSENPAQLLLLPEKDSKTKPALTFEQAQIVLSVLDEPYRTMALLSMTTSLNVAELCGLRWKRVNLTNHTVVVDDDIIPPMSFAVRENFYRGVWGTVKTANRNRVQPIPAAAIPALRELQKNMASGSSTTPSGDLPVFASRNGTPVDAHNANKRVLKPAGLAAGVKGLSWHSFRRTAATLANLLQMPLSDRVALMGHSNVAMTQHYTESDINRRREYVDQIGNQISMPTSYAVKGAA